MLGDRLILLGKIMLVLIKKVKYCFIYYSKMCLINSIVGNVSFFMF